MANWWESIRLQLTPEDRAWAHAAAAALNGMNTDGSLTDEQASKYWTGFEIDLYGRTAEAGIARYAGTSDRLPSPELLKDRRNDDGEDVPGVSVGVKCAPWRCIEHFHQVHGGRLIVPLRAYRFSPACYILCTYFTRSERLFLDGYATQEMIARARRLRSNDGKPAVEIPYRDLLPAADWNPVTVDGGKR